jgi:predicted ABC-type ATPase
VLNPVLNRRPLVGVIAGPNAAGKTTVHHAHLRACGPRFLKADVVAREIGLLPHDAARAAIALREELLVQRESFVLETVFSDPAGDKLGFLKRAVECGYTVVPCFVGISGPEVSEERVSMRVSQGGHDVPTDRLFARYPRRMANLRQAIRELPRVWSFDNDDLGISFRKVAVFEQGGLIDRSATIRSWLKPLLKWPQFADALFSLGQLRTRTRDSSSNASYALTGRLLCSAIESDIEQYC